MEGRRVVGVDVGGSGVRAALAGSSEILVRPLPDRKVGTVLDVVHDLVSQVTNVDAVGLAVPGFLVDGHIKASPNFPSWRDVPLGTMLAERIRKPVAVENDATAAAVGAWHARGASEDLVLFTLGTGVGGGAVLGGRVWRGATGSAGEFGHIYVGGNRECGCGATVCLETWCSTTGWINWARTQGRELSDGRALIEAAKREEDWALAMLEESGRALGRGARTIANALDPDVLVFAGGLTAARQWLEPGLLSALGRAAPPIAARIKVAWLGKADRLAIDGSARVALRLLS